MALKTVSKNKCFGGVQGVFAHASETTGTDMTFGLYLPPQAEDGPVPLLMYLSGLTCTHENVMTKGGAQRYCAQHGLAFLMPDTSPRGEDIPDVDGYDFGTGAGFYVDATQSPWSDNYKMATYCTSEILSVIAAHFSDQIDMDRKSITGHSMGGHGALTIGLKNPELFRSVSAFAPITSPIHSDWGTKALAGYLGEDQSAWRAYDACALIEDGARVPDILVDQGTDDEFLDSGLKPELLEEVCNITGQPLTLNMREGYDHSYYFISSFMADHVAWAADRLKA